MRVLLVIISFVFSATTSLAECKKEAILHDADFYMSEYCWTEGRVAPFKINVWDSPSLITVVGKLVPGTHAMILDKKKNSYKVKVPDEEGGAVGWINESQIERIVTLNENASECDY